MNYRCPPNIVAAADQLIRNNTRRIEKSPTAHRTDNSDIKVVHARGATLEARSVVSMIKRIRRAKKDLTFRDFAVLYRTNAQSLPLQIEFILNDIPYEVRKGDNILENESLPNLIGTLRVKLALDTGAAPKVDDVLALMRAYFRYVSPDDSRAVERALSRERDFRSLIHGAAFQQAFPKATGNFVPAVDEMLSAKTLTAVLDVMARRFHGLQGMIGSLEDVIEQQVPLGEIYEIAATFRGNTAAFVKTLDDALARARDLQAGSAEDGVAMRTYFRSKGLQWHTVLLTTCNEGVIPHFRAAIEDERRLFYVAMTRASSNLVISYVNTFCNRAVEPSRFLSEAGLI